MTELARQIGTDQVATCEPVDRPLLQLDLFETRTALPPCPDHRDCPRYGVVRDGVIHCSLCDRYAPYRGGAR
jgi:hypothetical protein